MTASSCATDADADEPEAPDPRTDPFGARDQALAPIDRTLQRQLKRVLADDQNGVLDRLGVSALHGAGCCGALAQHLPAKHLRTADIPALTAENVLLYALQAKQRNQVIENRMHQLPVRPPSTATPVPLTKTASSLARNSATFAMSTGSPSRWAAELLMQSPSFPFWGVTLKERQY